MGYEDSLDIGNRAIQLTGSDEIMSETEDSLNNRQAAFAYDKVRKAELRRNFWRFAIRRAALRAVDTSTMLLQPAAWDATKLYLPGSVVSDADGGMWISGDSNNTNNPPGESNTWDMYFGPLTISLWDSATSYFAGELVYKTNSIGLYNVFLSLQNGNTDTPDVATPFDATVTYHRDEVVSYNSAQWRSTIENNLGNNPSQPPVAFDASATYSAAQQVTGSDNFVYSSIAGGNIGNDPTASTGSTYWTRIASAFWNSVPTLPVSSRNWILLSASIKNLSFTYPIGSGPSSQGETRNVYRLPSGFLREAPQDPKAGSNSFLGAPSGLMYNDWVFEGDYIVTREVNPIIFRFVADITVVKEMDDMFCEGLACRVAMAICPRTTQSASKLKDIASQYKLFMGEARTVNAIEEGAEEPPQDDFITCRL